jgi:hypothetical protein
MALRLYIYVAKLEISTSMIKLIGSFLSQQKLNVSVEGEYDSDSEQHQSQSQSHFTTDGQSVSPSWCRAPSGAHDQIFILYESYCPVYMGRPL